MRRLLLLSTAMFFMMAPLSLARAQATSPDPGQITVQLLYRGIKHVPATANTETQPAGATQPADTTPTTPPVVPTTTTTTTTTTAPTTDAATAQPLSPNTDTATATTTTAAQPGDTEAPSVSLNVQFATGSAMLTPEAVHTLQALGQALNDPRLAGGHFRIEGHTDTVGVPAHNKWLSQKRAEAVVAFLAKSYHVDRTHLVAVGAGEEGLLVPTPPQTAEPQNRRVLIVNLGS